MIWTEDENSIREVNNMISRKEKGLTCKNCHWSGYENGDEYITCGHHHDNFISNGFCSYWTSSDDPKLLEWIEMRKKEVMQKSNLR